MQIKSIDWDKFDGNKMFTIAANSSETYDAIESACAAKSAEIGASVNAVSHGRFANPTDYTVETTSLKNPFPQGKVFTTSRGAYSVAAEHGLFRW